jgi:hypothetical protein
MLATTADELLQVFREEVNDTVEPYLWSDFLGYIYMTEGIDALANEAHPFYKVVRLAYTAGQPVVSLPRSILQIRSMRDVDSKRAVFPHNSNEMNIGAVDDYGVRGLGGAAMFDGTSGAVCAYVRDYDKKAIHLVPAPAGDGTLELQCTVTTAVPMDAGVPLPCTEAIDQRLVLSYMKWRAYSKHDAETEDLVRAKQNETAFRIGVMDREVQLRKHRRVPGVVRMEGW